MDHFQQLRNLKDFLLVYNGMTEICFQRCTTNFNYRALTMDEERCVDSCAGKLIRSNHRLMATYVQLMPAMVQKRMEELESKAAELEKAEQAQAAAAGGPVAAPGPATATDPYVPAPQDAASLANNNGIPADSTPTFLSDLPVAPPDLPTVAMPTAEVPAVNGQSVDGAAVANGAPVFAPPLTVMPETSAPASLATEFSEVKLPVPTAIEGQNTPLSVLPAANLPPQPSSVSVSVENSVTNLQPLVSPAPAPPLAVPPPIVDPSTSVSELMKGPLEALPPVSAPLAVDTAASLNAAPSTGSQGPSVAATDSQSPS